VVEIFGSGLVSDGVYLFFFLRLKDNDKRFKWSGYGGGSLNHRQTAYDL